MREGMMGMAGRVLGWGLLLATGGLVGAVGLGGGPVWPPAKENPPGVTGIREGVSWGDKG